MIVVDTSAWIEFLRDSGSQVCVALDRLLDADLAICDAIAMEVLAGARDEHHLTRLRGLLGRAVMLGWLKRSPFPDRVEIDGRRAIVTGAPFYDPEGARARA